MRNKSIRTDLAIEARELWQENPERSGDLPGVEAKEETVSGFTVATVKILDETGEKELCKPKGTYVTLELGRLIRRDENAFADAAFVLAEQIRNLLKMEKNDSILVAGLGNRAITPDAVGPLCIENLLVTRHLKAQMPTDFAGFREVTAVETGVLGTTGIESADMIAAVGRALAPDAVIAVDALASRKMGRICRTIQLSDTGIVPGSGVNNSRAALNQSTLGARVVAIGVPTVVDAATLIVESGERPRESSDQLTAEEAGGMIVTPRDIDSAVRNMARLIGYAVNLALHDGLTLENIDMLLG